MSTKKALKDLDANASVTPSPEAELDAIPAAPNKLLGPNATAAAVHLALFLVMSAQVAMVVGAGAYGRDIAATVGGSDKITWMAQAIAIITSILAPPVSQAADYWGRKWFLVISTASGFVGCLIISRATSMGMAIAGSVLCGLAYGSQSLLVAVASEILPRRYRTVAQSVLSMANAFGAVFGLLVGSRLVAQYHEGFRIFYYITAGFLAFSAVTCALLYNPSPRPMQALPQWEKLKQLDWIAYALLASGIILFSMALTWSNNPYPWKDPHVSALFAVSCVLLIGLGYHQTMVKKDGMTHHGLFTNDRNFAIALWCMFVEGMIFFISNSAFTYQVSVLYETSPFKIGLSFSISFFTAAAASLVVAAYTSVTKDIRGAMALSFLLCIIFSILMATSELSSNIAVPWVYPIILGIAFALAFISVITAAQMSAPPELISIASGLVIAMRSFGGCVAIAIYATIFNSAIKKHLVPDMSSAVVPLGLSPKDLPQLIQGLRTHNNDLLATIPGINGHILEAAVHALKGAYLTSFRPVWIALAVIAFGGFVSACFAINPKREFSSRIDASLEGENNKDTVVHVE